MGWKNFFVVFWRRWNKNKYLSSVLDNLPVQESMKNEKVLLKNKNAMMRRESFGFYLTPGVECGDNGEE